METVKKDQGKLGQLFQSFCAETRDELWDSEEEAHKYFEIEEITICTLQKNRSSRLLWTIFVLQRKCFQFYLGNQ